MFQHLFHFARASLFGGAIFVQLVSLGLAQTLPNHFDPSAYDDTLDMSLVPSIRFLTSPDFPPFNFKEASGDVVGYNVELAQALCAELEVDCTLQSWPWAQLPKALEEGQGDAIIAGLSIDAENGRLFGFSQSYLQLPARFVGRKERGALAEFNPHKLSGVVGVRRNSSHHEYLIRYFSNVVALPFDSELDVLKGVDAGTIDLGFVDGMRASFWLNQNECCDFAGAAYFSVEHFGAGLGIAVSKDKNNTLRAINMGLRRLAVSGKLDELYLKWFPIGFY